VKGRAGLRKGYPRVCGDGEYVFAAVYKSRENWFIQELPPHLKIWHQRHLELDQANREQVKPENLNQRFKPCDTQME